jgi:hypothetical protein
MDKTIKLASAIILIVILIFITEEVAGLYEGNKVLMTTTSRKCTSPKDCPDVVHRPNYFFSMCVHGFCAELIVSNQQLYFYFYFLLNFTHLQL